MVDDNKHTERVALNLTERELLDASREGLRLDMSVPAYIRYVFRLSLYGSVGMKQEKSNVNRGDE